MKLSKLEELINAMRKLADKNGIADPNVEFFDYDREAFRSVFNGKTLFVNMEPHHMAAEEIRRHVVPVDGDVAKRGDFAIPLVLV